MTLHHTPYLLGAHMSASGGLEQALYGGAALGCTCIQLFTHSNRQWAITPVTEATIRRFLNAQKETGITQIASHASYLINLGSPRQSVYEQSIRLLSQELMRCEALCIPYLIMHPGSSLTGSRDDSIQQIALSLQTIIKEVRPRHTEILLENMAGQGSSIGTRLEELASIRDRVGKPYATHIGFCIDTCHAFTAGYPIDTAEGYTLFWSQCTTILGTGAIKAIHLNDAKTARGSNVDRHEAIGKGAIGLDFFRTIMNDESLKDIPKIIETPYTTIDDHTKNLTLLRSLIR